MEFSSAHVVKRTYGNWCIFSFDAYLAVHQMILGPYWTTNTLGFWFLQVPYVYMLSDLWCHLMKLFCPRWLMNVLSVDYSMNYSCYRWHYRFVFILNCNLTLCSVALVHTSDFNFSFNTLHLFYRRRYVCLLHCIDTNFQLPDLQLYAT